MVYLADDLKHERKVALKVLKPELHAHAGVRREASELLVRQRQGALVGQHQVQPVLQRRPAKREPRVTYVEVDR